MIGSVNRGDLRTSAGDEGEHEHQRQHSMTVPVRGCRTGAKVEAAARPATASPGALSEGDIATVQP